MWAAFEDLEQSFHRVQVQSIAGATDGSWLLGLLIIETVALFLLDGGLSEDWV